MVNPYNTSAGKKIEVKAMFDTIASNYDFLNHFLSFGIDVIWRKRLITELKKFNPANVVDIATGTADLAIMAVQRGIPSVTGIDLSEKMVEVGNEKIRKKLLQHKITLLTGDAEALPFNDNSFDAAMVAFGVRNFEDLGKGLKDIYRVLVPGGALLILEFSQPQRFPIKQLYHFYSFKILPLIGKIVSRDSRAYSYLPESIKEFPFGKQMVRIMEDSGYKQCRIIPLSFHIATIYVGIK